MGTTATPQPELRQSNTERRSLLIALSLITGSLVVEIGGAFFSGSLALLADAADMVTNFTAISLALLSLWMARRPATVVRTFGLLCTEVLVAMLNALTLWVIAAWIFIEAYERLHEPPEVEGGIVLVAGLSVSCLQHSRRVDTLPVGEGKHQHRWSLPAHLCRCFGIGWCGHFRGTDNGLRLDAR